MRRSVRERAGRIANELKANKQRVIAESKLVANMDNYMRYRFIAEALNTASEINRKLQQQRHFEARKKGLLQTIENSQMLQFYDKSLITRFVSDWQQLAEQLKRPECERIQIKFKSIEIPDDIVKPVFRIYVLIERKGVDKTFNGAVMINGDAVTSDSRDYQAVAIIRKKVDASSLVWRLLTGAPALDESIHSDKDEFDRQYEPYTITFDSIARENIDFIRFKFTLHDENDQLRALYYAKLEHLFKSSKRGKDVTLNLGTSPEGVGHLLHLAVTSHRLDHLQKKSSYMSKFLSQDYVQDINFNYSFSFPKITPRSSKLLALLPESWKVIDEGLMSNHRSGDLGAWIQRVKYRLARHYHRNSSKHLAKLEQTNILWANLQDELAQYSLEKPAGSEDIFIDEVSLEKILEPYQPRRFNSPTGTSGTILKDRMINLDNQPYEEEADNGDGLNPEPAEPKVISYLFKRDQWDSNQKWYPYYLKLSEICRRGIPPQLRKIVWSELSRVCYFIELTERFLAQAELQRKYEAFDPIQKADAGSGKLTKSRLVYDKLCSQASREFYYLYQELEEDIEALREKQGKEKLDYEANLRNICRTFIYWSHLFANIQVEEVKYYVSYSRAIVTLCQGLVIALSCSYLQSEVVVEEDAVFWLLISLTSYILASYYETNEEALSVEVIAAGNNKKPGRKNNKITLSALRCPEMKGIKGDILLLKLLLKELEPEIFYKFEELGLPIEEFFADHMLTLFSTLLNPSLAYRVWDMVFFEGSASNQVRSHRMAVVTVFTILRNCKKLIAAARTYKELTFVLELYCKTKAFP